MRRLAILGAGSWGTSLALVLASRFEQVRMWAHQPQHAAELQSSRVNAAFLPGFAFPGNVTISSDMPSVLEGAEIVLLAVPSQYLRGVCREARPHVPYSAFLVSGTKGIEKESLLRMSEVIQESIPGPAVTVLSGPTFAREIAAGEPAAVVIASRDLGAARTIQQALSTSSFRIYTNDDIIGVEIGAALKNVIAIGAGICHGLGMGGNTMAALVTRGLAEISRLAEAVGGRAQTLAGLAGMGDLVLTCTGQLSRNRQVGIELGRGRKLGEITGSMRMVAEGVETTTAAWHLARSRGVSMPIVEQMFIILHSGKSPAEGIRDLMARSLKGE